MTKNIPVFAAYRQIELFSARNCSADDLFTLVAASGQNTWCVPRLHVSILLTTRRSSAALGSAVYQLAHVPTGYPAQHEGIVIAECSPSAWLPDPRDVQ